MRLDVLLFELRLYKSRTQATAACQAGHVRLNGMAAKPSRAARPGDVVQIAAPSIRAFEILELPRGSLSKEAARRLMRERPEAT